MDAVDARADLERALSRKDDELRALREEHAALALALARLSLAKPSDPTTPPPAPQPVDAAPHPALASPQGHASVPPVMAARTSPSEGAQPTATGRVDVEGTTAKPLGARELAAQRAERPPSLIGVDEAKARSAPRSCDGRPTVDLLSASVDELQALPGVGPALARRIVEQREREPLTMRTADDLLRVKGVGAKAVHLIKLSQLLREEV